MKITQRIWIVYVIVLSLNCLTAKDGTIAAKRHFINAVGLIQPKILAMPWIQNLSGKICYFGEEILLLFLQEMWDSGFVLG